MYHGLHPRLFKVYSLRETTPICFTTLAGERIKIWRARIAGTSDASAAAGTIIRADRDGILVECGSGQLLIQCLQLAGGKPLEAAQVLNARGALLAPGNRFALPAGSGS